MPAAVSKRASHVAPFQVMSIVAQAQAMQMQSNESSQSIIQLAVGESDEPTPNAIANAGVNAIQQQMTRYSPALGLSSLREAIADYYFPIDIQYQQVGITMGASAALQLALLATADVGDSMVYCDPGYPCNQQVAHLLGIESKVCDTQIGVFQPTLAEVQQAWQANTRVLLLASPANPSGAAMDVATLESIVAWVAEQGGWVVVDEIYHGLILSSSTNSEKVIQHSTALQLSTELLQHVVVVNSFSKTFGMTGWRLGWMVAPQSLIQVVERMAQNLFLAPPTIAQHAAMAAFEQQGDGVSRFKLTDTFHHAIHNRLTEMTLRHQVIQNNLHRLGFLLHHQSPCHFYVFADARNFTDNATQWCQQVLLETGVAIAPGIDFGAHYAGWIRIAATAAVDVLQDAFDRIEKFIANGYIRM